ncbi:MAG: hypothetical protein AAFS10_22890, partial [Myxococcota bacterium]
ESCGAGGVCRYRCSEGRRDADGDLNTTASNPTGCECIPSEEEVCDGEDNTCDGAIDEVDGSPLVVPCERNVGVCAGAVQNCAGSAMAACSDDVLEDHAERNGALFEAVQETVCDGEDNDCDGNVDEVCCAQSDALVSQFPLLTGYTSQTEPTVAVLPDGRAALAWIETGVGGAQPQVRWGVWDPIAAQGTMLGAEGTMSPSGLGMVAHDSGLELTWQVLDTGGRQSRGVHWEWFGWDGANLGATYAEENGELLEPSIAARSDGQSVVITIRNASLDLAVGDSFVMYRLFGPDGSTNDNSTGMLYQVPFDELGSTLVHTGVAMRDNSTNAPEWLAVWLSEGGLGVRRLRWKRNLEASNPDVSAFDGEVELAAIRTSSRPWVAALDGGLWLIAVEDIRDDLSETTDIRLLFIDQAGELFNSGWLDDGPSPGNTLLSGLSSTPQGWMIASLELNPNAADMETAPGQIVLTQDTSRVGLRLGEVLRSEGMRTLGVAMGMRGLHYTAFIRERSNGERRLQLLGLNTNLEPLCLDR